jgi:peptidoglycan/xylan/chitin deacetylase (PgdA/CDA1 family)
MKLRRVLVMTVCALCMMVGPPQSRATDKAMDKDKTDRQVAVTIDDLPGSTMAPAAALTDLTSNLLGSLRDRKVPVVGFVNESGLYRFGEVDARIKALQMWLDYGFELGNHTYSHSSLNHSGLRVWEDDVVQGENVTRLLLAERKMKLRYFRHPFLDMGSDLQTRREAEAFLAERGYRVAPVTVDAWDWMFAKVYDDAKRGGDAALQQQVVQAYLAHSDSVFAYMEQLAKQTIGYEPKQVLLLHFNQLEADHIGELLELLRKRGYRFITLEDALSDPAYGLPDTYVGDVGRSWIEHWAITLGKPPQGAPAVPQWVIDLWNAPAQTPQATAPPAPKP